VEWLNQHHSDIRLICNSKNKWFCAGHNKGIKETSSEYLLLLNPDVFIEPEFLKCAVRILDENKNLGGVQGKLWQIQSADAECPRESQRRIDTTGSLVTRSRRNFDRYQEELDDGRFDQPGPVFGPDGSAPVYRREMLEDIKINGEFFDENFLAYREIVDLNWRARSKGWIFLYDPSVTGFHVRGFSPKTRFQQSVITRRLSYRNRYLTLVKNESLKSFCTHFLHILGFEAAMAAHVLLREPSLLPAWIDFFKYLPGTLKKRRKIQSQRSVPNKEITAYFVSKTPRLHRVTHHH